MDDCDVGLGLACLSCRSCCGSISLEVLVGLLEFESEIDYFQKFETELKVCSNAFNGDVATLTISRYSSTN